MVSTVLNFTVAANTSSAEAGAKRVGAAFNELGGASSTLASRFEVTDSNANRVAKSLGVELSSAAERTVTKLEGLRDHLVRTGAPAADMQRVTEALAAADQKYAASLTVTTQRMGFWAINGAQIAATAGAMGAAVLAFGAKSVEAFSESQKVMAQTDAVLKSTGGSAGVTKEMVLGLADALSKVTPFDDEVIQQGENLLLTFTNIGKDVFPRAIESALDLATALGIDVVTASKMLGKALDQPAEGLGALSKATGKFTEAEQVAIKEMVEMGNVAGAQAVILDKLDEKYGKSARTAGEVFAGQIKILRTELGNLEEDIGGKLVPTLEGLIKEFPEIALVAVAAHDGFAGLNVSFGELLIAVPLLKTAFGTAGASLAALGATAVSVTGVLLAIGAAVATVTLAFSAWSSAVDQAKALDKAALDAQKATAGLTKKAAEYGITLQKGNETQEQYNARIFQAITAHEKLHPVIEKVDKVAKSHVITLQEQIEKQKALVERLKFTEGASEKLTAETAKLDAMLRKQAEAVTKVTKEHDALEKQYASTTGKIVLEIQTIEKDIAAMEKHKGSADALAEAKHRLGQKTLELIASQSGHKEILDKTTVAFQENTVAMVGNISATERLEMSWREYIDALHEGAAALLAIDFDPVISDADMLNESLKRVDESTAAWEKMNDMIKIKTPEALKPAKQGFDDMSRQVSTVVTDLGKGIADALVHWEGFGKSMIKVAREFGSGILRTMIETWFKPLEGMLEKVATKLTDVLSGALSKMGGMFGKLFKPDSLLGGLATSGIMAGLGVGISALTNLFTRRGKEKTTATGAAEDFSSDFWQGTFKDVEAGRMSVDEGLLALNASWDKYVKFLNETLKDQTVIQRSLDTQRVTLTEGTAALEKLRGSMTTDAAVANLQKLGAQFMETGEMSADFAASIEHAGGSVEAFNQASAQIKHLTELRNEFAALKQEVDSFLPKQKSWMENFMETGEITDEMAAKIREAGGDINQFKKFADMKAVKTQFQSLIAEFEKTGVASEELLEMIKEFGGNDAMKAFDDLMDQAKASGKTLGQLAKDSEGSAETIQAAFDSTSQGINKAFGDAAKQLSDTLTKMDENLGKAIESLQAAMVTMIKDLIDVLLGVPGAAEKAARDANFFLGSIKDRDIRVNVSVSASGIDEMERRLGALGSIAANIPGGITSNPTSTATTSGGGDRTSRDTAYIPRMAEGGIVRARPGGTLVNIGEGGRDEAVIPLGRNGATGGSVTVQILGNLVTNNATTFVDDLERTLQTNREGSRVRILKALKLAEPGKF